MINRQLSHPLSHATSTRGVAEVVNEGLLEYGMELVKTVDERTKRGSEIIMMIVEGVYSARYC